MAAGDTPAGGRPYRLTAHIVCHDSWFCGTAAVVVVLNRPPTTAEAEAYLWPAAEALLARYGAEGSRLELVGVRVVATLEAPDQGGGHAR